MTVWHVSLLFLGSETPLILLAPSAHANDRAKTATIRMRSALHEISEDPAEKPGRTNSYLPYSTLPFHRPFCDWKDPGSGEWLRTCTIITGEPSAVWRFLCCAGCVKCYCGRQKPKSTRRIGALLSVLASFFDWCATHGLELKTVRPFHVAAWIEDFPGSKPN